MFGCVICIYIKQLQITLNSLRTRHSSNKHYYMTIIFHHGKKLEVYLQLEITLKEFPSAFISKCNLRILVAGYHYQLKDVI